MCIFFFSTLDYFCSFERKMQKMDRLVCSTKRDWERLRERFKSWNGENSLLIWFALVFLLDRQLSAMYERRYIPLIPSTSELLQMPLDSLGHAYGTLIQTMGDDPLHLLHSSSNSLRDADFATYIIELSSASRPLWSTVLGYDFLNDENVLDELGIESFSVVFVIFILFSFFFSSVLSLVLPIHSLYFSTRYLIHIFTQAIAKSFSVWYFANHANAVKLIQPFPLRLCQLVYCMFSHLLPLLLELRQSLFSMDCIEERLTCLIENFFSFCFLFFFISLSLNSFFPHNLLFSHVCARLRFTLTFCSTLQFSSLFLGKICSIFPSSLFNLSWAFCRKLFLLQHLF